VSPLAKTSVDPVPDMNDDPGCTPDEHPTLPRLTVGQVDVSANTLARNHIIRLVEFLHNDPVLSVHAQLPSVLKQPGVKESLLYLIDPWVALGEERETYLYLAQRQSRKWQSRFHKFDEQFGSLMTVVRVACDNRAQLVGNLNALPNVATTVATKERLQESLDAALLVSLTPLVSIVLCCPRCCCPAACCWLPLMFLSFLLKHTSSKLHVCRFGVSCRDCVCHDTQP
jgi:hypothetical protein